ncbi:MAG: S1-like domain-containing RNA-binding protein [Thermodesulfobacteriota bacterium]
MAEIGRINKLTIKRLRDYGVHFDGGEAGDILLKSKDVPESWQPGDEVEVFVYQDRQDRLRASTQRPSVMVGQFAKLRVKANAAAGSYLDWGLQKDLFVPKNEQQDKMVEGKSYVVFVFLDEKTKRITASSKLEKFLNRQPPSYKEGEEVDLIVYEKTELGFRTIVNHAHEGMVYKSEVFKKLFIGQEIKGYIKKIREDLKIDLILQKPGYKGVDDIAQTILKTIRDFGGTIALTDKSPPEDIYSLFGVSKKVFKKAIGALYKKRLITMDKSGIKLARK